mmetsp:Transcript_48698/g.106048  ORF Transcript_48698/g.106048 Transcript_48698/m.106048 type:complete len:402 (+) Transcript_48698:1145-2350(+)
MGDRAHGVIPRSISSVGRSLGPGHGPFRQAHVHPGIQLFAKLIGEVSAGELIGIIDEEGVVPQQLDCHVDFKVVAMHELVLLARLCLWSLDLIGAHGHLSTAEEDREVVPAAIQWVLLPNFDCVICQEEHDGEGPTFKLRSGDIIQHCIETKHLLVLFQELLHISIDVTATEHHLAVDLLIGSRLHRSMVLHCITCFLERIQFFRFRRTLGHTQLFAILPGERVTVSDKDATTIDLKGRTHTDVLRLQVATISRREAMTTDQLTLWHTTVVLLGLLNLASIILQIVVDDHLPHTEILQVCLDHRLLEIAREAQDMSVKGIPCRKLLKLDVSTSILEHCARLAVWQGTRSPNILHFAHLHKFGLVMGNPIFLLDSHAVDQVPRVLSRIVPLPLSKVVARQIW